jgi:hypothetical protein
MSIWPNILRIIPKSAGIVDSISFGRQTFNRYSQQNRVAIHSAAITIIGSELLSHVENTVRRMPVRLWSAEKDFPSASTNSQNSALAVFSRGVVSQGVVECLAVEHPRASM